MITNVAILVRDYDEAIDWYTKRLRFQLLEDTDLGHGKRWIRVRPPGGGTSILLARAKGPHQESAIGNQSGGRVFLFLSTSDFWSDYEHMKKQGVEFTELPRDETYGTVVVFLDLYGNKWDLVERRDK